MTEKEIIEAQIDWLKKRMEEHPDVEVGEYHEQLAHLEKLIKNIA